MPTHLRPPNDSLVLDRVRELRVSSTDAERELWFHLRARRLNGLKFRRQHPVPPYIVDFFCEAAMLVIELDGSQHDEVADAARTRFLEAHGMKVMRFWDNDVLTRTEAVLEAILNAVGGRPLTPTPLPLGEGLKAPYPPSPNHLPSGEGLKAPRSPSRTPTGLRGGAKDRCRLKARRPPSPARTLPTPLPSGEGLKARLREGQAEPGPAHLPPGETLQANEPEQEFRP
ncbi:MAG: endonuclease domain-containing protein [Proteobacteria bacterium]|nr:endonuclease domain-containing protein [Pseudomonadota bacterium]